MPTRGGSVHVVTTRRHYKDKVYETTLLRRSYREGGKVKSETVGNLSHLPPEAIAAIRQVLKGQTLVTATSHAEIGRSLPHGDVSLVWSMARTSATSPCGSDRPISAWLVAVTRVWPLRTWRIAAIASGGRWERLPTVSLLTLPPSR